MAKTGAKRAARKAERSEHVDRLARFGLVCRGVIWSVIGVLALMVAFGSQVKADKQGALGAIKQAPLGTLLLAMLALGFAGYALWRLLQGSVGHRDCEEGPKRWAKRGASLFRAGLYVGFAFTTARFLLAGDGGDATKPATAKAMALPGGTVLVALVGFGLVVAGVVMAVRGLRQDFEDKLKPVPRSLRGPVHAVATVGLLGRALVFALLGCFLLDAARTFDPDKARGLDAALKTVAAQPLGGVALGVGAVGLLAFALWSFAEARWRRI